jgi:alkylation response protein AidB-like acyl-CoA dehydrogenase
MDVRLSAEQLALRDAAVQMAERLGPHAVAALEDAERASKLDAAIDAAGWRELRAGSDDGGPWASAVEVALVVEELGRGLADVSFLGPTMAADLRRLAGAPGASELETVLLSEDLSGIARAKDGQASEPAVAVDVGGAAAALVLVPGASGVSLGRVALDAADGPDLTRASAGPVAGARATPLDGQTRLLDEADLVRFHALGLALASADLVGVMRGATALAADYARSRQQYGASIGSFQAVQHLLADAHVSTEGSRSIALHAAWAVDALDPPDALTAASAAKAYCGRAARAVCETAIQIHGGIGNTWECLAHVFLRRALLSSELYGGVGACLERVLADRGIGGDDGLR